MGVNVRGGQWTEGWTFGLIVRGWMSDRYRRSNEICHNILVTVVHVRATVVTRALFLPCNAFSAECDIAAPQIERALKNWLISHHNDGFF